MRISDWSSDVCSSDLTSREGVAPMKQPGPDHPIEISPFGGRVRVLFEGRTVADTSHALMLEEASYPPVFYIPRDDRSDERRVGKARVSTGRSRGTPEP